ncbi:hypothetical protein [Pontibacterium sp.]|uniref:hypothetical protein n=1 Tax=Pontibacterium sp. TaxID=2036026 RepID=UPI003518BE98
MADLSWLDLMVLTVVVLVILISFSRFIRRSLKVGCGKSRGCAGCSGCDAPRISTHTSKS